MCYKTPECVKISGHPGQCYVDGRNVTQPVEKVLPEEILDAYSVPHYNQHPSGIECITIVEHYNFNLGNVIKYVWRAGLKTTDPKEDLEKAKYYIEREIERLK